jgi:glycosyltransferase involved in cell wall biosynthesis
VYRTGVTIAVPNWNHELLLPRAISSALAALEALRDEGGDGEVLVIDDQSRDGSVTLLRQLEALHFGDGLRVVALAQNGGLSAARNAALARGRFRHIVFLDADNELVPANTPCLWRALEDTGAAAAYGTLIMRTVSAPGGFHVISNESFQDGMYDASYVDAFAMFDRGQLADLGGYSTAFTTHEDHEQWLHLAANGRRILFVPVVFGYYYLLPTSMSADVDKAIQANQRIRRIFNQTTARKHLDTATRHLRYHPALGYL